MTKHQYRSIYYLLISILLVILLDGITSVWAQVPGIVVLILSYGMHFYHDYKADKDERLDNTTKVG